ncbi:MAG: glycosyltransferase family 2 protein [Candidatus Saccharimonadales bacterium]
MKISILMPSYNDADSIGETLNSILAQTYLDYEVIIIDDGSSDNTGEIVKGFIEKNGVARNWRYIRQENADQLNAILNGLQYITGDYAFILHSDDLFPDDDFLKRATEYISNNSGYDAYTGDLCLINDSSKKIGIQMVRDQSKESPDLILSKTALFLGRNLYVDFGFFKREVILGSMKESYLTWNMPFWLKSTGGVGVLKVKKMPFEILKYRQHENNYHTNYKGQLNIINGELRTATTIMAEYDILFYRLQFFVYRIFRKLHIEKMFRPIFRRQPQRNISGVIKYIIMRRFGDKYVYDIYLNALVCFFENRKRRTINMEFPKDFVPYSGKDNNTFNKNNLLGTLDEPYKIFLREMSHGFSKVVVKNDSDKKKVATMARFFCVDKYIKIEVKS